MRVLETQSAARARCKHGGKQHEVDLAFYRMTTATHPTVTFFFLNPYLVHVVPPFDVYSGYLGGSCILHLACVDTRLLQSSRHKGWSCRQDMAGSGGARNGCVENSVYGGTTINSSQNLPVTVYTLSLFRQTMRVYACVTVYTLALFRQTMRVYTVYTLALFRQTMRVYACDVYAP